MRDPVPPPSGGHSMVAPLRRVMVRRPAETGDFAGAEWPEPDRRSLTRQHEAFCELLDAWVDEVVVEPPLEGMVDACFTFDPVLVTDAGAVVLRAAKPIRRAEGEPLAAAMRDVGVPTLGALTAPAVADGGDLVWLDASTLLAARGYRTNAAAHQQLEALLAPAGVTVDRCDLPHDTGPAHVLHLMSVVSPVSEELAVVFEPLAPVPLLEALREREIDWVAVDRDEYETLGSNVLAVAPGVVVVVDGNPRTRAALEARGVEVHAFDGTELSLKGAGGPTCLTAPLWREMA